MGRAFVIRPFGTKKDSSGREINFDQVHEMLIGPALQVADLGGSTTGEIVDSGNIREDMFALILEADLVVCDITVHNANVFYELGIRHALRKKRTVLIKGEPTSDGTPFDLLTDRYLPYQVDDPAMAKDGLSTTIRAALKSDRETDSPIFQMLPSLAEADPSNVQVVPLDFREEVNRARVAKAKGWLRLLSEEVRHRRFKWEGLKLVAAAQWDLKDYEGACDSWETIREIYPDDIPSNLALANIFERLYRQTHRPEWIEASDQAIDRVRSTGRQQRAEALALRGRNQKTHWRVDFGHLDKPEERRKAAMNRTLIDSYEAYREALYEDLNHFYPGLAALQMGTVLLDLSKEEVWYESFGSDREAESYQQDLEREVADLQSVVSIAVRAALRSMDSGDPERIWAKISEADVLFLTDDQREQRVTNAYRDAIPKNQPFAWDATRGQLELFADLSIKPDLARRVIFEIDTHLASSVEPEPDKPVQLVLFVGHQVDTPDRSERRFPSNREDRAKALISEAVKALLVDTHKTIGLASAAPGADILLHEVFDECDMTSTICLPMPAQDFARLAFKNLDSWRTRFLDLQSKHDVMVLCDRENLPRWLHDSGVDPWERGNEWVMKMALTWGADHITLIALWDGKQEGDAPGGTAHMVRLAEDTGQIHIKSIDTAQLLS